MANHYEPAGNQTPGPENQDDLMMKAATRMADSLAEILVGHLPYDVAAKLLRHAYLHAAYRKLQKHKPDKRVTKSALALISGLDTRIIKALEEEEGQPAENQLSESLPYICVLTNWALKPGWQDPETGRPLRLKIYGEGKTFRSLVVYSIAKNISYQPVLDELVKKGNVRIIEGKYVELHNPTPDVMDIDKARTLDLGSMAISALHRSIAHNVELKEGERRRRGSLAAEYHIPVGRLAEVQDKLESLLDRTHDQALEILEPYRNPDAADTVIAGVGMFYWQAKEDL